MVVPPPLDAPMLLQIHGGVRALETIHTPCAGNSRAPPAGGPAHVCTQCIALRHWPTAGPNGCWGLRYSTAIPGAHPLPAIRSQGIWIVSMRGYIQRLAQRLGPTVPITWLKTYRLAQSLPLGFKPTMAPCGAAHLGALRCGCGHRSRTGASTPVSFFVARIPYSTVHPFFRLRKKSAH